jgi:N6-adenosine-specific RNA methylase IME4
MNLVNIAARIKAEHEAVAASAKRCMEHAIAAGELLIQAKDQMPHGQWLPWLEKHCGVTTRSAQNYMKLAKHRTEIESKYETVSHLTVREALHALAAPALTISSLKTEEAKKVALESIKNGQNIRMAGRGARKLDYYDRTKSWKPKALEGPYRIIYADPPWLLEFNQRGRRIGPVGIAADHYDCLTVDQICKYRVGNRTVKELADKNAILFMWVTATMLEHCFQVIEAWGFQYKTHFVWDKVRHNLGHYISIRHELLMICTRGTSCTPDTGKLINSVQTIERSDKHSEKPEEFYDIIDAMYDHGRKLELFSRKPRVGWDCDGNEAQTENMSRIGTDGDPRKLPDKVTVNGQPMDIGRLGPVAQAQIAEALNQNGLGKEAAA